MKRTNKNVVSLLLCLLMVLCLAACRKKEEAASVWENAKYTEDTEFGEGSKILTIIVEAEEKKVTFTIASDAETVGEALFEHELVEGEAGDYGLYMKAVNGIRADYDVDKAYWGFYQNGEYMMAGVDQTPFVDGDQYELVYTKE